MASTQSSNKQKLLMFAGVVLAAFLLILYIDSQASKMTETIKTGAGSPSASRPAALGQNSRHTTQPDSKVSVNEASSENPKAPARSQQASTSSHAAADAVNQANEKKRIATNEAAAAATKRKYSQAQATAPASAPATVTLSINIEGEDPNAPWHLQSEEKLERVDFDPMAPYRTSGWIVFTLLIGTLGLSVHGLWHVRRGDVLRRGKLRQYLLRMEK